MRITNSTWTALRAPVLRSGPQTTLDVLQSIQSVITSGLPLHTLDLTARLKDRLSEYLLSCLPGEGKEYCLQFTRPVRR